MNQEEIERLASLGGVSNFDDWKRQMAEADQKLPLLLDGTVRDCWDRCLPIWSEQGRVNDLSRGIRVPKYWPSFARVLGRAFAESFSSDWAFLIGVLNAFPSDSVEYLCAYDLLEMIAEGFASMHETLPADVLTIALPIPPVVQCEINGLDDYADIPSKTIGGLILRQCQVEYGFGGYWDDSASD